MTFDEVMHLLELVGNRTDELGLLTRKLIGEHLSLCATGQSGDVDADGEIIDQVDDGLLSRLKAAIGEHRAANVEHAAQLRLVRDLLAIAGARE